jgi:hypothetical protein
VNTGNDCSGSGCPNPDGGAPTHISIPGSVLKVPIDGGVPTTLASGQARPMDGRSRRHARLLDQRRNRGEQLHRWRRLPRTQWRTDSAPCP